MNPPFEIIFSATQTARAVRVQQLNDLPQAVRDLGLPSPRPVVVVVGGAAEMDDDDIAQLRPAIAAAMASIVDDLGALVIDGGVDSGVMRLMGEVRAVHFPESPLVGVALEEQVNWPGHTLFEDGAPLEPHHSHFILTPGADWGDEAIWMSRLAASISPPRQSLTLLINGGEAASKEVAQSVRDERSVIVVAGSGRLADELIQSRAYDTVEHGVSTSTSTRLIQVVSIQQGHEALQRAIKTILTTKERHGTKGVDLR